MKMLLSILFGILSASPTPAQDALAVEIQAQATSIPLTSVSPPPSPDLYPLTKAHLFEPFWKSNTVYGEAVALVHESGSDVIYGTLLFTPNRVLSVHSSDEQIEYEQGKDYSVDVVQRRLVLTSASRIPSIDRATLYKKKGDPHSIAHKADDPDTYLMHAEQGFRKFQVVVDYDRAEPWTGIVPSFAGQTLSGTITKLKAKEGLRITVTGDSISSGNNASNKLPPYSPNFSILTQRGLEQVYGGDVTLTNLSVGGTTTAEGLRKIPEIIKTQPDLVIIAFGMNDMGRRDAIGYAARVRGIIDGIRAVLPKTEFILIATSVANPEWSWSPADQFPLYRDALKKLTGPGIALADMTELWIEILTRKRFLDLTGNGINHPNDYGHHLYAQALLAMMVDNRSSTAAFNSAPATADGTAEKTIDHTP